MVAEVRQCKCKHDFQDKEYGKGNRVCNVNSKDNASKCTVCGTEHRLDSSKKK